MAHFAKLDENNVVTQIVVIDNSIATNELAGIDFCHELYGNLGRWIQTSYNCNFRKNFAAIGFIYDEQEDAFIPPQPYPSWILDPVSFQWKSPVDYPDENKLYVWDEESCNWIIPIS